MHGIPLEGGVNHCYWNVKGKCTNTKVTRNKIPSCYSRDWNSKQNCVYTIYGVYLCGGFKPEKLE